MEHHKVSVSSKSKNVREFFKKIQQQKATISGDYL
jgi:protein involved in ribonucleotide reduction